MYLGLIIGTDSTTQRKNNQKLHSYVGIDPVSQVTYRVRNIHVNDEMIKDGML